ncbi:MAG: SCP2 sterol-binding domain-containing protein, partial [Myxococcales bacterium]
ALELSTTLESLKSRFKPGTVQRKTVYYLSLGDGEDDKWTVTLTPSSCELTPGKTEGADCVLKTSRELFTRLVDGSFKPGAMDIVTGKLKTNDPQLLVRLQQAFGL